MKVSSSKKGAARGRRASKPRRPTVTQILKAAYRRYTRDRMTRLAVKQCLG